MYKGCYQYWVKIGFQLNSGNYLLRRMNFNYLYTYTYLVCFLQLSKETLIMKKILLFPLAIITLIAFTAADEDPEGKKVPSVMLKDMYGNDINTAELSNDGKPIVISFWATWCKPCKLELNTIADVYEDWQDETGVKVIAVSIDDEKTKRMVEPTVNASGWEYDVWMDPNGDFKRAMGVNIPPQSFLINGNGEIVYSHVGFVPGDEEELYDHILELVEQ